jgi:hypothetical protein
MKVVAILIRDLVGIAGAGSVAYGAWLLHPAAGFIVGGALALAGAIAQGRADASIQPMEGEV